MEIRAEVSRRKPEGGSLALRAGALIAVLAGGVGSSGLMLYADRHNHSLLLPVLFAIWVLSPFVALVFAYAVSKRGSVLTRAALYSVMLVLALDSLGVNGDVALWPPGPRPLSYSSLSPQSHDCLWPQLSRKPL